MSQDQKNPSGPDHVESPMQGEGNYDAARRHRESAEQFVKSGQVDQAARDAAPESADDARRMGEAEQEGRSHARD